MISVVIYHSYGCESMSTSLLHSTDQTAACRDRLAAKGWHLSLRMAPVENLPSAMPFAAACGA